VVASPGFAHTLDSVFKDADKYQPKRYLPPREEDKTPFSYIAFGGGRHGCLGQNFAYLQIKVCICAISRAEMQQCDNGGADQGRDDSSMYLTDMRICCG
jgi:cytochrome P450